jgi:hypothetical protein
MLDGVLIDPSVSFDGNVCTLLLDAPLLFYTPQTLTISASFFSSTDPEPLMVAAISTTITIKAPAFSVVIAYNRHSYQTLYPGDLVMLVDRKTSITDDNDVTQEIPDIVGQVATLRSPHSHAYSRFDYGGSVAGAAQLGG